jgi:hypothetical protein
MFKNDATLLLLLFLAKNDETEKPAENTHQQWKRIVL